MADPAAAYPTGWDAWGHLFKAQYLSAQMAQGHSYPALLPWWYDGLELFRYWSPLPIYILSALKSLGGSVFLAGAWLVPAAAAFGGLSWLFYARRLGWAAAVAAGLAWTVWPDHVWVALLDGNLPRVVATALLPLLFLTFLDSLELRRWPWSAIGVIILLQLVVLCHAMIAAMVAVAMAVFCLFYWLVSGVRFRGVVRGTILLALGVLSSAWWLLPSLSGGMTSISTASIREAILSQPSLFQVQDARAFFSNIASLGLLVWVLLTWKNRHPVSKALWVCGLLGIGVTIPWVVPFYLALPLSHLMWPARFASLLPVAVLGAFLVPTSRPSDAPIGEPEAGGSGLGTWRRRAPALLPALVVIGLSVASGVGAQGLVHTGERNPDVLAVARELTQRRPGWRVALLDLGHLTSQAAFDLSDPGRREQIYGFAYQGAAIGPALVLMNTALEHEDYAYAVDRAWQCGATDLVVGTKWVNPSLIVEAASAAGFGDAATYGSLLLLTRPASPQAFVAPYTAVAIGRLSAIISMLFPSVETGRARLDSYTENELAQYDTVFLTGVEWESRTRAEQLVRGYVKGGGHVIVDLTQFPKGILNDCPSFLGVAGERVSLNQMPAMLVGQGTLQLQPLSKEFNPWVAVVPQGLDQVDISFGYYGQPAALLGTKKLEGGDVTFIGMNLPYHAYLTRDPEALSLLAGLLGTEPGAVPNRTAVPLESYRASSTGYGFGLSVPAETAGRRIILPFAATDSIRVRVDGTKVKASVVENLIAITSEPGQHEIRLEAGPPPLAGVSGVVSIATGLLAVAYVATWKARAPARRKEVPAPHG